MTHLRRLLIALALCAIVGPRAWSQGAPARAVPGFDAAHWIADAAMARAADSAQWNGGLNEKATPIRGPFPIFRKGFTVSSRSPVRKAVLIATALGSYQVTLNGQATTDAVLSPDWTDYRRRVSYQTYDVTRLVRPGANAIGVLLGEGWYGSAVRSTPYLYGSPPIRVRCALIVTHVDGQVETITSDGTWRSTAGPVQWARIFDGETYDARALPMGWNRAGFDDAAWTPVRVMEALPSLTPAGPPVLESQRAEQIRPTQTLKPVRRIALGPDTVMYDFGQNMVGWTRISVRGPAGATVQVRHAELIMPDRRHIDQGNLRNAAATEKYTLAGRGTEVYEPHFTYHGFRYIEVVTSPGVRMDAPVGVVFHTAAQETATFESSDPKVSRLWQNIVWSLRGNLMSVPTDCPQRAERLGWLGDAAAFWPTAVYLMDLGRFTGKWLADLRDGQQVNIDAVSGKDTATAGCFPATMPPPGGCGGPAWSDAGVLVPYAAYRQFGDTAQVRTHWASMERYMQFIARNNPDFRWTAQAGTFGDWGAADRTKPTGSNLLATALWAADAIAMRNMAHGLGERDAEARYAALYDRIRAAFAASYISEKSEVGERLVPGANAKDTITKWQTSQTSDILALRYGLLPDTLRAKVAQHLVDDIAARKGHLGTGFVGTPRILPTLSENGRDDIAYQLLLENGPPSWLYMIDQSATTTWEYWDGSGSWNHYANGSVGEWLMRYAVGIAQDSGSTGFQKIVIHPHVDPYARLTRLAGSYRSRRGRIASAWTIDTATMAVTLTVTIPPGQQARVDVPVRRGAGYGYVSHSVGEGTHRFREP